MGTVTIPSKCLNKIPRSSLFVFINRILNANKYNQFWYYKIHNFVSLYTYRFMRILKYIFLLLLLALVGITVYVATQKGDFEVTKSSIIKTPRSTVFDYVNDYKNWETFGSWMSKDSDLHFNYGAKTIGAGAK